MRYWEFLELRNYDRQIFSLNIYTFILMSSKYLIFMKYTCLKTAFQGRAANFKLLYLLTEWSGSYLLYQP